MPAAPLILHTNTKESALGSWRAVAQFNTGGIPRLSIHGVEGGILHDRNRKQKFVFVYHNENFPFKNGNSFSVSSLLAIVVPK